MSTWYEKGAFYHMYPLGMTGAPKQNEGACITNRFEELNQWIPHIQSLGCNAIYIGPLFESSTHGYDTKDYKIVDRRLGDNESFKIFVSLCHESGIKVVVDGVFNHTGRGFFAFSDIEKQRESSPYKDWYKGVNFDSGTPLGDSFSYEAWQGHYELPCLNLYHPEVRQYLFDVVQFWIDEFDIDGIRLDCANVLDFNFMKELRSQTARMKKDFWLMGEVIHGDYSRWVNPEMLDSVTNYELHKSIYSAHNDRNYFEVAHNVRRLESIGKVLYTFLDNHDEDRIASKLMMKEHLIPTYLLLFTLPGIPSIYYGGEWGLSGKRTKFSDDDLRPAIAIADAAHLHCELTDFISRMLKIRSQNEEFGGGNYKELLLSNRYYAFARYANDSAVIVAANIDDNTITLTIPVPFEGTKAVDLFDHTVYPVSEGKIQVPIKANQGMILKIRGKS